jgi:hypothetical protein
MELDLESRKHAVAPRLGNFSITKSYANSNIVKYLLRMGVFKTEKSAGIILVALACVLIVASGVVCVKNLLDIIPSLNL